MPYFSNAQGDFVDQTGAVVKDPAIRLQIGQSINGDLSKLPKFSGLPTIPPPATPTGTGPVMPTIPTPAPTPPLQTPNSTPVDPGLTSTPTPTPTPTPAPAPVTPSSLETNYTNLLSPSTDETTTQTDIDKLIAARDLGLKQAEDRQVALPFIVGEQKSRLESANLAIEPLQQKLARLQAQRQASLDASRFALDRADKQQAADVAAIEPVEVSAGNQLVNPTTGQSIYTAPDKSQNPLDLLKGQQAVGLTDSSKPFYFVGQEVRSKATNKGYATPAEAFAAGVAKDYSNVEQPNVLQNPVNILKKNNPVSPGTSPTPKTTSPSTSPNSATPTQLTPYLHTSGNGNRYVDLSHGLTPTMSAKLAQDAAANGIKVILNPNNAVDLDNIKNAYSNLATMAGTFDKLTQPGALSRFFHNLGITQFEKLAETDPQKAAVGALNDAASDLLKAISGIQGGRFSQQVINDIKSNLPTVYDTQAVASQKLSYVHQLIANREEALIGSAKSSTSSGSTFNGINLPN